MLKIESAANPRIKRARKIQSGREKGYCLVEGRKLLKDAVASGIIPEELFITPEFARKEQNWLRDLRNQGTNMVTVPYSLMQKISDVETPPGVVGIVQRTLIADHRIPRGHAPLLVSIRDPGNLGAIIRSAEATGCEFVACTSDCVNPYLPKVIRASMGSVLRVPLVEIKDPVHYLMDLKHQRVHLYGLYPHSGKSIFHSKFHTPCLLSIGSEGEGLPLDLPVESKFTIPMAGKVESLNTAVAAAICFYQLFLQKKQ